ncbi:MAG: methyltransferase domain-containing protein, partial [Planctomycetia bacterium]
MNEYRLFWREFRQNFHTTGAVLPSGKRLARKLARFVGKGDQPKRILEVGAGTGAVTHYISKAMGPEDQLDLVELNASFADSLRTMLRDDTHYASTADRIRVLETAIEDFPTDEPYDVIVSGLPLNNFSVESVQAILDQLMTLLKPDGTLSFFEYIAIRRVKAAVSRRDERHRLRGIGQVTDQLFDKHEIHRDP